MISEIRIGDISNYNFACNQDFSINDISNIMNYIKHSIDDISKWFNDITNSMFYFTISISDIPK